LSQAIERVVSPEEREYGRYVVQIERRKQRVAELRADLAALTDAVAAFHAAYHARVGRLFVELDRVRLAIDEYERRIDRLTAAPDADPATIEDDIRAAFSEQRRRVDDDDAETRRQERLHERERQRPELDAEAESEAKRLYRELAKRFHPDLARSDEERAARELTMKRVNAAFGDRSLESLRLLAREAEILDPAFEARSIGEKLVWAIREVARLDDLIATIEADLAALRASETHALWSRQQDGEPVIDLLAADVSAELARKRDLLAELIATYRQIIEQSKP